MQLVLSFRQRALIAKADIQEEFRILLIHPSNYYLLGFKWKGKFYFDRRLPIGASILCSTFEQLSRALQWIMQVKLSFPASSTYQHALDSFLTLSQQLGIRNNESKTVLPSKTVEVNGLEFETIQMQIRLPPHKLIKAKP